MFRLWFMTFFGELKLGSVDLRRRSPFRSRSRTSCARCGFHSHGHSGQVFVFFVMVVAAAEAAVGLAIIISVFRTRETLNVDRVNLLKL